MLLGPSTLDTYVYIATCAQAQLQAFCLKPLLSQAFLTMQQPQQDLLQWAAQRGGHHQRAWALEALGADNAPPGAVSCPLSNWFLEMWAMKSLSAVEVVATCIL